MLDRGAHPDAVDGAGLSMMRQLLDTATNLEWQGRVDEATPYRGMVQQLMMRGAILR